MITRKELLKSKEYWLAKFQAILYKEVEDYLAENNMSKTDFADKLGVTKGYISQILNGDFDHKISKFIELSLVIDKAPILHLEDIDKCVVLDEIGRFDSIQESTLKFEKAFNFDEIYKHTIIKDTFYEQPVLKSSLLWTFNRNSAKMKLEKQTI